MNKFKGILLCTDLDGTLLASDKSLSDENRKAMEYFMQEGGMLTFATGRAPIGIKIVLNIFKPNAPMICFNGGAIYDFENDKILYGNYLDHEAIEVFEYVEKNCPSVGMEVFTDNNIYFCKENRIAEIHRRDENLRGPTVSCYSVTAPWKKCIFLVEPAEMADFDKFMKASPYAEKYDFMPSDAFYYEMLPKGVSKGSALPKLAEILGIDSKKTIGIGDNMNDLTLVKEAGIGIAVSNAQPAVREIADYITVDNNSSAIAAVITSIELGRIKFN